MLNSLYILVIFYLLLGDSLRISKKITSFINKPAIICTILSTIISSNVNAAIYTEANSFQVTYPDNFVVSPKPLKTHEIEFLSKSEDIKGYNFGVTVDRVKVDTIKDIFKEPLLLANKVTQVEKSKEGVFDVTILNTKEESVKLASSPDSSQTTPPVSYIVEYKIDSSRGQNHYLVKSTIINKKLYVATVQTKDADWKDEIPGTAAKLIDSLVII